MFNSKIFSGFITGEFCLSLFELFLVHDEDVVEYYIQLIGGEILKYLVINLLILIIFNFLNWFSRVHTMDPLSLFNLFLPMNIHSSSKISYHFQPLVTSLSPKRFKELPLLLLGNILRIIRTFVLFGVFRSSILIDVIVLIENW